LNAAKAFRANFPRFADRYIARKIDEKISAPRLLDLSGGEIHGILGCPPCQGLSQAGLRNPHDERNALLDEMLRLIRGVRPRFFIVENVPSLLGSIYFDTFESRLIGEYDIHAEVVNAAEYGIPQLRRRAVIIGFHRELGVTPSLPRPTHGGRGTVYDYFSGKRVKSRSRVGRNLLQLRPYAPLPNRRLVTLDDALADLPTNPERYVIWRREENEIAQEMNYEFAPRSAFQRKMRVGSLTVRNHASWRHSSCLVARLTKIPPGDCPSDNGSRHRNTKYFSQAYSRLHEAGLARTITTNFHNPGSGRFTHYAADRSLTIREALRLQSFPDTFVFQGMHQTDAERLVGNAFPRWLARVIGRHVATQLKSIV
jgi:DNA (cytosine-5)-methyltransferase 1